jgi:hypothetical protein
MALNQIPVRNIGGKDIVPTIVSAPQANVTGTVNAVNGTVVVTDLMGVGSTTVQLSGAAHAGMNIAFEALPATGSTWVNVPAYQANTATPTGVLSAVIPTNGTATYIITPLMGYEQVRIRVQALTSGTLSVLFVTSAQWTPAVQTVSGSVTAGQSGTWSIVGTVANGTADAGNPLKVGGKAYTTNPTAVTTAARSDFITDKVGKQVTVQSIRDLKGDQATTITSSTTETTIVTATAATFNDVFAIIITNTSTTGTEVVIRDVAAGTPRFSFFVPGGDTRGFMLNESAAYKQTTVNTAWTAQCGTSVASIKINASYVRNI